MSPGSYRLENGYAIFADSKQSLRPLSFLSRTENVSQAFLRVIIQDSTFHKADCCGSLQTATAVCLVESRVLYVGAKESLRNISRSGEKGWTVRVSEWWIVDCYMLEHRKACCCTQYFFALYEKAMCNIHPLCSQRSTPTCHFDVMARTRKFHRNFCRPADFRSAPTMSVSSYLYV